MDEAVRELGRRALAAGFICGPGVLLDNGERVMGEPDADGDVTLHENGLVGWGTIVGKVPDFGDPTGATRGALLEQVREAWKDPGLACVTASHTHADGYRRRVIGGHHHGSAFMAVSEQWHDTEAAALVAALEAAP